MGTEDPGKAPILTARQSRPESCYLLPDKGNRLLSGPDQTLDTAAR